MIKGTLNSDGLPAMLKGGDFQSIDMQFSNILTFANRTTRHP